MSSIRKITNIKNVERIFVCGFILPCTILSVLLPFAVNAAEQINDDELSAVVAQDGLTVIVDGKVVDNAGQFRLNTDSTVPASAATLQMGAGANDLVVAVGNKGVSPGGTTSFTSTLTFDAGNGSTAGLGVDLNTVWNRTRLEANNVYVYAGNPGTTPSYGFGDIALDSSGSFQFVNNSGSIFSSSTENYATNKLRLTIGTPQVGLASPGVSGQFYYRQGSVATSPELILDKLYLDVGFTPGTGGMVSVCTSDSACAPMAGAVAALTGFPSGKGGVYFGAPHLDFNLTFSLDYRGTPVGGNRFTTNNADINGIAYWGWTGGFNNAELLISAGGIWPNTTKYNPDNPVDAGAPYTAATRTEGLNLAFHGDYDSNFSWIVGQAGGRALLFFDQWQKLPGATWALNAPNITLDPISGAGQGPGGLCWGGNVYGTTASCTASTARWGNTTSTYQPAIKYLDAPPQAAGMALAVRDLSLQAYSTNVTLKDDMNNNGIFTDASETASYGWGLIYTLGVMDENLFLYPGNAVSGATANGITADVLLMAQSFNNGTNPLLGNTNLMIADTATNLAYGLVQANVLFAAKSLNFSLLSGGLNFSSTDVRAEVQGVVGGGPVPAMTQASFVKMFYVDMNLESTLFNFTLSPQSSGAYPYLGYDASLRLGTSTTFASGSGSYFSLGEPSSPLADFRLANITGDIKISNGRLFLISAADATNAPDGVRRLQIAQTMQFGSTASLSPAPSGASIRALQTDLKFGSDGLGKIVLPSGQMYNSLTLKPQGVLN